MNNNEFDNNSLKDFVDKRSKKSHLRVQDDLGDGFFRLRPSEAQRRQAAQDIRCNEDIVIEMLRNSRDAGAKNIYLATNKTDDARSIVVIDDGIGIDKAHHQEVFEPYVTSKLDSFSSDMFGVHGRGMALYSISINTKSAYVCRSFVDAGCSISVTSLNDQLPEKKDQSTFPNFYIDDNNSLVIRGPKNITRSVCEFAIESRDSVNVFIGSPTEIAACMYQSGANNSSKLFKDPDENTKCSELLHFASDAKEFVTLASSIGLTMSERTARRIIDHKIEPAINVLTQIAERGIKSKDQHKLNDEYKFLSCNSKKKNHKINKLSIKLTEQDKEKISLDIKDTFSDIAKNYYLNPDIKPLVSTKGNEVIIKFEVNEDSSI